MATPRRGRLVELGAFLLVLLSAAGCLTVTIYQPQHAIQRPVVVERAASSFEGLRVLVRCNAHDAFLPVSDASRLCGKLADEFERQGAETEWVVPSGANFVEPAVFDGERPDLTVEIESRIDHEYDYPLSVCLSCCSCTMLPSVREQTFSQRVVVIGRDRSVLTEELFRERFVEYGGCGVWGLNWVLDWVAREKAERISGDVGKQDFTRDFYGQVRQLAFNARVRAEILGLLGPPGPPGAAAGDDAEADDGDDEETEQDDETQGMLRHERPRAAESLVRY